MSFALAHVRRNRKVILLFALMVLLPAAIFGMFLARSVRSDRLDAARQEAERRRQIARLVEDDLSNWLFSIGPDSARSKAFVRFELAGDTVVFPDLRLSLPVAGTLRPSPLENAVSTNAPTAESLVQVYYPRIVVFLRDFKAGAQYFQRLHAVIVRAPDSPAGYVLDTDHVMAHVTARLASLASAARINAAFSIADLRENRLTAGEDAIALGDYPFFQVVFGRESDAEAIGGHGFAYTMSVLIALTILGSVFLYRAVSQEIRLSQLQTDFVSAVSHEFRSPLSSIMALSERLASAHVNDPEKLAEYHRVIGRDARRLSALVTRLLDFAQIEEGRKAYSQEGLELVAAAREAVDMCRESVRHHPIEVLGEDAAPLWVRADPVAVRHCIQNLIENAAKYSAPGSPIRVSCGSVNGSNTIDVSDQGIGIPTAEQEKIFQKFYRGRQASTLDTQGVGIGLALVRHVMDWHRGSVDVESEPGRGSRFRLSFPKAEA
jgi:two-component system phosphate regulon sensor histidine kinase PhoR